MIIVYAYRYKICIPNNKFQLKIIYKFTLTTFKLKILIIKTNHVTTFIVSFFSFEKNSGRILGKCKRIERIKSLIPILDRFSRYSTE